MEWDNTAQTLIKAGLCGPLLTALAAKGLAKANRAVGTSPWLVRLHGGSDVVIINKGQTWYDLTSQVGGNDPVFAAMHVLGLTSPEAALWIVENVEGCPAARALRESLELRQASSSGARIDSSAPKKDPDALSLVGLFFIHARRIWFSFVVAHSLFKITRSRRNSCCHEKTNIQPFASE